MLKELASQINIFKYITFRASYAAVTALIISLIMGPGVIRWLKAKKLGQEVRADGPQTHLVKEGTPTMGGILIIFAIVISVLLWQDLRNSFTWLSLFAVLGFGAIGFTDDWLKITRKNSEGLTPRRKLLAFSSFISSRSGTKLNIFFVRIANRLISLRASSRESSGVPIRPELM